MARRDGMGPFGQGPFTGKGLGCCISRYDSEIGLGLNYRRGLRKRVSFSRYNSREKDLLEEKVILESRLNIINEKLEKL